MSVHLLPSRHKGGTGNKHISGLATDTTITMTPSLAAKASSLKDGLADFVRLNRVDKRDLAFH